MDDSFDIESRIITKTGKHLVSVFPDDDIDTPDDYDKPQYWIVKAYLFYSEKEIAYESEYKFWFESFHSAIGKHASIILRMRDLNWDGTLELEGGMRIR